MSSSMRNAVQRRQHRERAQPLERQKLGLLEKHKDYSLRAADHKQKQRTLKNLRAKAASRNEDEFYFGMMSRKGAATRKITSSKGRKWDGIVDGDRGSLKGMDVDLSRLLKTQDLGYLRTMRNVAGKEVKVLEERVIALGGSLEGLGAAGKKRGVDDDDDDSDDEFAGLDDDEDERPRKRKFVFSEAVDERDDMVMQLDNDNDELDDEDDDDASGRQNSRNNTPKSPSNANNTDHKKNKKSTSSSLTPEEAEKRGVEQKQVLLGKLERRLEATRRKVAVLARAENKLELQRAKMAKTPTVGGVTKSGKKFKVRERKR